MENSQLSGPKLSGLGHRAKEASLTLALAGSDVKDEALRLAGALLQDQAEVILEANRLDVQAATEAGSPPSVVDRLRLSDSRIGAMAAGMRQVADLADPVGEVVRGWVRPNGLEIRQVRVPLGVVGIIYENRPNVTSDAAALCIKSGNAAFLRGSSGAIRSNKAIAALVRQGLGKAGLPTDGVLLVEDTSRESAVEFMQLRGFIDCLIPRGGPSLIQAILDHATVPYVIDGNGNCHVYVDAQADLGMAVDILVNSKTQRPSVCNAAESLVVHSSVAAKFIPMAVRALEGVELVGDEAARRLGGPTIGAASDDDYSREFLDLKLSVKVVESLDQAISHIRAHGSGHTEAIVTGDLEAARRFVHEVDAAAVVVNASTRFTDGECFGFGAEIGISTQKLHARGPMGLRELTTAKYVITGTGQTRS